MTKKIRFYYWLIIGLIRRHIFLFLGTLSFLTFFIFYSSLLWENLSDSLHRVFSRVDRQYYTEGVVGIPKVINPLFATSDVEKDINELVFQNLIGINTSGEPIPELASSFESVGDREYTINLKKDIFWHDAKQFSADDVVYTFKIAQDPEYKSQYVDAFKDVKVEKIDAFTLKFKLKEPFAPFLTTLNIGAIPSHIPLTEYRPIGTGFFRVKKINNKEVVLTKGWLDLTLKFYPDYASALTALKLGEIQGLGGINSKDVEIFKKWPNFKLYSQPMYRRFVALYFNVKAELFSDKNFRIALRHSISKERIIRDITNGTGAKASGPVNPNSWAARETKDYEYNPTLTISSLEKSGWKRENGGWNKEGRVLSFNLSYPNSPMLKETAASLISSWQSLGIKVEERAYDPLKFKEHVVIPKNFDIVLTSQEINPDPDQYVLWHSTQINTGNTSGFSSPKIDKVLEDGRISIKQEERRQKYLDFQKYIFEESPAIFLYFPPYNYLVSSRIKDLTLVNFNVPSNRFNSSLDWRIEKRFF